MYIFFYFSTYVIHGRMTQLSSLKTDEKPAESTMIASKDKNASDIMTNAW